MNQGLFACCPRPRTGLLMALEWPCMASYWPLTGLGMALHSHSTAMYWPHARVGGTDLYRNVKKLSPIMYK